MHMRRGAPRPRAGDVGQGDMWQDSGCVVLSPGLCFHLSQVEVGEAPGHPSNLCYQTVGAAIYPIL